MTLRLCSSCDKPGHNRRTCPRLKPAAPVPPRELNHRTVQLRSGAGSITILTTADPTRMTPEDRACIGALVDMINAYELDTIDAQRPERKP